MTTTKTLDERISAILSANDFMMMDVHRPMLDEEIKAIHPQAVVDKSLGAIPDVNREEAGVGASQSERCDVCFGPMPCDKHINIRPYNGPFVVLPDNVEVLDVATSQALEVDRVLQSAHDNNLTAVLVVGYRQDGELFVLASEPRVAEANLLCDLAKGFFMDAIKNKEFTEDPRGPKKA